MRRWCMLLLVLALATGAHAGEAMVAMAKGVFGGQDGEGYLYPPGWTVGPVYHLAEGTPFGAVLADGSLLCWAYGMGLGTNYPTPVISNGVQMLMGNQFALVRRSDGSVMGWGNAVYAGAILPVPALPGQAIDLAMGNGWAAALLSDGSVVIWGSTPLSAAQATQMAADAPFKAIEANGSCLVGLRTDGSVRAYGSGGATFAMPVEVSTAVGVQMISAAYNYTAALMPDGSVRAWGPGPLAKNWPGPFDLVSMGGSAALARRSGSGAVVRLDVSSTPDQTIAAAAGATQLRATSLSGVHCRLADGSLLLSDSPPVNGPPVGLDRLRSVATGNGTCVGVQSDGRVAVWGKNRGRWAGITYINVVQAQPSQTNDRLFLLLADGSLVNGYAGNFTLALSGVRQFDTYDSYAVGARSDGTVAYTGTGGNLVQSLPVGLSGVIAVATGNDFAVALKADGTVLPWGAGTGQVVPPADLGDVIQLDCGYDHVLALRRDGTVRGWGGNGAGQTSIPVGLSGVVQVAADGSTSYALKADGTVVQWGQQTCPQASLDAITHAGQIHGHNVLLANRNVRPVFLAPPRTSSAGHVLLDVSWNWPVTGFASDDVTVSNGTINAVTGSGATWQLDVSPAGPGAVTVSIAAAAVGSEPGWASLPGSAVVTALALGASDASASTAEASATVITLPNPNPVAVTYQVVANPGHGTLSAFNGNQITYSPALDYSGPDTFTYRVTNGAYWSSPATVTVTVRPVNRAPTLTAPADCSLFEDGALLVVTLGGIDPGRPSEAGQSLTITTSSSQPGIVPPPAVTYTSPAASGNLTITPAPNAFGSADITVTVRDNGGTADGGADTFSRTFHVEVKPVNDAPTLAFVPGFRIDEDAAEQTVSLAGISPGPANEAGQPLTAVAFSTEPDVVGHPTVDYTPGATTAVLHWHPELDAHGQARVFVTFVDNGGTAYGGADSVSQSFLITVDPVNDPPVLVRNDTLTAVVGEARTIGDTNLLTKDVDVEDFSATLIYTVVTPPTRGQLRLGAATLAAGGQFTQADIHGGSLVYAPPATVGTGTDSFSFHVGDGVAPDLPTATVSINILPSGGGGTQPPLVAVNTGSVTWTEGDSPLLVFPAATLSDPDSLDFDRGTLTIELFEHGSADDRLLFAAGGRVTLSGSIVLVDGVNVGGFAGGVGMASLVLTCNASANPDRILAVLRAVAFRNVSDAPNDQPRSVQVVMDDGDGGESVPVSREVKVVPVNTPPSMADLSVIVAFTEGDGEVGLGAGALAVDADSPQLGGGYLKVALTSDDTADHLVLVNAGQVTVSGSNVSYAGDTVATLVTQGDKVTPLRIDFAGIKATPVAAQAVLRSVRFANDSKAPTAGPRTLSATLNDGLDTSAPVTVVVAVTPLNNAPVVALPDAPAFVEGLGTVAVSPNATLGDPDSADLAGGGLTIRLATGASVDDVLLIAHQGNGLDQVGVDGSALSYSGVVIGTVVGGTTFAPLVVSFNPASGVTPAMAQAVLRRLAFANASNHPAVGARSVGVIANDGDGGFSAEVLTTLQVTDSNSPPVLAASGTGLWTEDTTTLAVAPGATISDGDSLDLDKGFLAAVITTGISAGDRLLLAEEPGVVALIGNRVLVASVEVGTWSGGLAGDALRVDFISAATPAAAQILAQHIVFDSTSQDPPTVQRGVQLTINDGDGDSAQATVAVDVQPNNDPPALTAQTLAVVAGVEATFVLAGSDPEGDACKLELGTVPDAAIATIGIVDAAARSIRIKSAAGFAGTFTFTAKLSETAAGGLSSPDRVFTVRVTGLDEPRPLAASEPPRQAHLSQTWTWQVQVDASAVADALPLSLHLEGAPAGMTLVGDRVEWPVPIDQTLGAVRFGVRFVTATGIAGWQDVLIIVRPVLGGGG